MPAHMKGREENLLVGTLRRSLSIPVPSMGHRVHQLLAILCVTLSLALVALGDSDPTQWILPLNPELWQTPWQSWDPFWIWLAYPMM
jgi:hypothetical protein